MIDPLANVYTDAVHSNLKQYATWPIGALVKLGDYGRVEGTRFQRKGNIYDDFGIQLEPDESPVGLVFDFQSVGIDETKAKARASGSAGAGSAAAIAKATLKFANSNSVYFRSIRLTYSRIDNFSAVSKAIMEKFKAGSWEGSNAFVHDLFSSGGTTVIVSTSANAVIDIEAGVKGLEQIDLADANAKLSSTHSVNVGLKVIANKVEDSFCDQLVPLFSLSGVRPRFSWFPFLGEKSVRTLLSNKITPDVGAPAAGALPGRMAASMEREVSPKIAADVRKEIGEVYHNVQIP